MFKFLGMLLGFSIRSKSPLDWHLTPLLWKRIIGQKCTFEDLDHFDTHQYTFLKDIKKHGSELKADEFEAIVDETFVT